jgi:hypothetical protein
MSESFSFETKKKLANRIQKLSSKTDLIQIKKIIVENNPELEFMKNSNGYFTHFHNLSGKTYTILSDFLNEKDSREKKKMLKDMESEICDNSELLSEEVSALTEKHVSKKLRLTNTENHILNRAKYEKELKKNESNSDNEAVVYNCDNVKTKNKPKKDTDIFIKNDTNDLQESKKKPVPKKSKK